MTCDNFSDLLVQARAATSESRWSDACTLWTKVNELQPDLFLGYTGSIEAYIRAYRFGEAKACAAELKSRFPNHLRAELYLAGLAGREGKWDQAVRSFEDIGRRFPNGNIKLMWNPDYRRAVINAHGILEGSRRLELVTHSDVLGTAGEEACDQRRQFIFVSGMPRAGTTALGNLLNRSTSIAIFTELHNYLLAYSPASFSISALRKICERRPVAGSPHLLERSKSALFVGDKRPLFDYSTPHTLKAMSGRSVFIFHILRPLLHVAASFDIRAQNPEDAWDPLYDLTHCIHQMNNAHRFILDWLNASNMERSHKVVFVDYERVFSDAIYAAGLFADLELKEDLGMQIAGFHAHSAAKLLRNRAVPPKIRDTLTERLDFSAAHRVAELTGVDILKDL